MYFSDLFNRGQATETLGRELNLGVVEVSKTLKPDGVGLSKQPGDQTKNSFPNRQIVNKVSFSTFDFF